MERAELSLAKMVHKSMKNKEWIKFVIIKKQKESILKLCSNGQAEEIIKWNLTSPEHSYTQPPKYLVTFRKISRKLIRKYLSVICWKSSSETKYSLLITTNARFIILDLTVWRKLDFTLEVLYKWLLPRWFH